MNPDRTAARMLAKQYIERDDPLGWFEPLYARAKEGVAVVPWADMTPNPYLVAWLNTSHAPQNEMRALKIGCGLGDDAEELSRHGFSVVGFDISPTAIQWCKKRFPQSTVQYVVADLFHPPSPWLHSFDFVLESYTLQVLPPLLRREAIRDIRNFIAPGGTLLVICRGRSHNEDSGLMPWPLTREELNEFIIAGLRLINFSDFKDNEESPVRRFRAEYRAVD